jgi:glutamate synthase (NADPH) small chain
MGSPKGFMEIDRRDPGYRPEKERVRDFKGVERQFGHNELQRQAARCMDCGTPFCHAYGCPVSNVIPEFNDFVFRGKWRQALEVLLECNNFPEFTGRVCPAPCEAACVAGINGDPVAIRQIELAVIERGFESDYMDSSAPEVRHDERVAVIGSGPAGLAVADCLNRAGYRITVYDSKRHPGGILRYGIPDFKLEKWVVDRRIRLMERQGVSFETGVTVGEDISYGYLSRKFDAICLAGGARAPRDLAVPGRDLKGVHFAMDYLVRQNMITGGEPVEPSMDMDAAGRNVVIIGGGDTGSDCLGTALRQGARQVCQLEILPQPPARRAESTPWPEWPLMLRPTHAHKEGGVLRWSVMTREFRGGEGKLTGVDCAEVEWRVPEGGGSAVPEERPGTGFLVEADLVLLAMGFVGPGENRFLEEQGVRLDERGNVWSDDCGMTSVEGLFVAGDMHRGQSLVVRAVADGRRTAAGIRSYLEKKRDNNLSKKQRISFEA